MFHLTASLEIVSLLLLKTKLLLLPPKLLAFTGHTLCLFTPFLKEQILKKIIRDIVLCFQAVRKPIWLYNPSELLWRKRTIPFSCVSCQTIKDSGLCSSKVKTDA